MPERAIASQVGLQDRAGTLAGSLAHAVAAEERNDFAGADVHVDPEQDLALAVGGLQS